MKKRINSYRDLIVWQRSIEVVMAVYELTEKFPREEIYGLTSQMRRSAVSIPSNIAEGAERDSPKEYIRFLHIAKGSAAELRTQIYISCRIGIITIGKQKELTEELKAISKMLQSLIKSLNLNPVPSTLISISNVD